MELWGFVVTLGVWMAGSTGAGLIWAIRQEGRINGHDQLFVEREKQGDEKFDAFCELQQERHEELLRRMDRFDRKLDAK